MKIFMRYLVAGGTAAAVWFLVLIGLVELFGMYPLLASGIGFVIACLVNYTLQYHWTFEANGTHSVMFTKFMVVSALNLCVNTLIFWYLFEQLHLQYIVAQFISTAVVTLMNFLLNKHYTFKAPANSRQSL